MITKQYLTVFVLFFIGSTMAFGGNSVAGRDSWIGVIIGTILALIVYFIYFKLIDLYEGKKFLQINKIVYGEKLGKFVNIIYGICALLLAFISVNMLTFFINITSLTKTSTIIIFIFIIIGSFILAKSGSMSLVRFSEIVCFLVIIITAISLLLSISDINISNILPVLDNGTKNILSSSYTVLMLPFLEGLFVLALFYKKDKINKRVINIAIIFSGVIILLSSLRNLFVLGYPAIKSFTYPSYAAVSLINLSSFIQREEVLVSIVFVLCYMFKSAVLINFASLSLRGKNSNKILATLCVLLVIGNLFMDNIMKMFEFILIYKNILVLPLIILPIITIIVALIKERKRWI